MEDQPQPRHGESETPQQALARRRAWLLIWVNVIVIAGVLMYLMWFWHATPVSWQQWTVRLLVALFYLSAIRHFLAKTFAD